ncbi:MAG: pyruvate kinase [Gemmatimonadaceae bacterium]
MTRTRRVARTRSAGSLPDPAGLLRRLQRLRAAIDVEARQTLHDWRPRIARRAFLPSARNLAHYLALRSRDLRALQAELVPWGLSSLGRSEARVLPNLDAVIATLAAIAGDRTTARKRPSAREHLDGERRLAANTNELFGRRLGKRRIRIMVTMSSEAADDYAAVRDLLARGMDCARINCAHDDQAAWERIAAHVRAAARELRQSCRVLMDLSGPRLRIEAVRVGDGARRAMPGDRILFRRGVDVAPTAGNATRESPFEIACSVTPLFKALRPGHRVFIDGGKIDAEVETLRSDGAVLLVTRTGPKGGRLAREKGLNFPDTEIALGALTDEDRDALDFVVAHADIIGYSFVQSPDDIAELQDELSARTAKRASLPALIAKIETQRAVEQLPAIVVQAAGRHPFGVMIARGDLGVELGYERLAEIQEEILWLSEAAHIPVVWATQVLERLVTKGTPSRAEMTDAAMGERAECVMLNKGPYVADAVGVLDDILTRMQSHQRKKSAQLRELRVWQ